MRDPEPTIEYVPYTEADADATARLLAEVFAERDPPAVAAGVTVAEFEQFVRLLLPHAGSQGLTVVARDIGTGEIVGAMLCEDSTSPMPDGIDRLAKSLDPVFDILVPLDEEYRPSHPVEPGESIHLFLLGVARSHSGKGMGKRLVGESLANAVRRGYRTAVTEATNLTSQHIFRSHGFTERVRRSYADHRFDGRAVFAGIAEHGGPVLMDRPLGG